MRIFDTFNRYRSHIEVSASYIVVIQLHMKSEYHRSIVSGDIPDVRYQFATSSQYSATMMH